MMPVQDLVARFYGSVDSLRQVYTLAQRCKDLPGDFVECGIAMGSGIAAMKRAAPNKRVWGYDSFQGIHMAGPNDTEQPGIGPIPKGAVLKSNDLVSSGATVHPREQVNEILFNILGFKEDDFVLVEGWVQETLPKIKPKKIAFLRLDMDLYDPTLFALQQLYPRLVNGGILLIDDGNLKGVVKACEDYFQYSLPHWYRDNNNPFYLIKNPNHPR